MDLKKKKWPVPPGEEERFKGERIKKFLKIRAEYEKSAFVSEGHIEVRRLGPIAFTKPIPPEESAITALTFYHNGKIYGGTSGKRAHLFYYDPSPDADAVVDIGIVGENLRITSLVAEERGKIFGAVARADGNGEGFLFSYSPCEVTIKKLDIEGKGIREVFDTPVEDQIFHSIIDPCHSVGKMEVLTTPAKGEGITSLVLDEKRKLLYGLSDKKGIFFIYDISKGKAIIKGLVDEVNEFSKKLIMDKEGVVYGAKALGELFRYDPEKDRMEDMGLFTPSLKGRELYNRVDSWALDEETGLIYGGSIDGILFVFDPIERTITAFGKPIDQTRIRAITVDKVGRVFGVAGEPGSCAHLVCYNPETRELKDLGVPLATVETPWYGYEFESAVTGKDGEIYLGESDRISHLWIYYPPMPQRQMVKDEENEKNRVKHKKEEQCQR